MSEQPSDDVVESATAGETAAQAVETNTVEKAIAMPAAPQPLPRVRLHMIETLDGFANVAKATGTYNHYVNAVLCVAAVILAEIDEAKIDETLASVKAHAGNIRMQIAVAAAQTQPQGANDVKH